MHGQQNIKKCYNMLINSNNNNNNNNNNNSLFINVLV